MRKLLVLGFVGIGFLAGCGGANIPAQMTVENTNQRPEFLMGEVTRVPGRGFALQRINFRAEGLDTICEGTSLNGAISIGSNGLNKDSYKLKFPINCDDGRSGMVMLDLTIAGYSGVSGSGYGEMSDGSIIKLSVGNTSGGLRW